MDAFAVMGLPYDLELDAGRVRGRMQALGKIHHPDSGGSAAAYQEIVEAAAILSVPSRRLRHWAELQGWIRPAGVVDLDAATGTMFAAVAMVVANARQAADAHDHATSALGRALAERRKLQVQQELADVLERINLDLATATGELREMAAGSPDPQMVAALADRFAYLTKWQGEARDALARLV